MKSDFCKNVVTDFDIFEYNKKYLRICSIHVVSQFKMSSADSKGYQFLVEPIMKSFELLMNSDEKPDIDCFAILVIIANQFCSLLQIKKSVLKHLYNLQYSLQGAGRFSKTQAQKISTKC